MVSPTGRTIEERISGVVKREIWSKKGADGGGVPYLAMHDPTLPLGNSPDHHHFTHILKKTFKNIRFYSYFSQHLK